MKGYKSSNKHRHRRRRTRHEAASSIGRAWRNRKRRKIGLVQRTVTANRRSISSLRKTQEIKEKGDQVATVGASPDTWAGQQFRLQADYRGETTTGIPAIVNPLWLNKGTDANDRIGNWVQMTSLSYHVQIDAETGTLAASSNRVGMLVVLDTSPMGTGSSAANLYQYAGVTPLPNTGSLLDPHGSTNDYPWLMFKNKGTTTGPDARYKILRHHKGIIQPQAEGAVKFKSVIFSDSVKAPYKLNYDDSASGDALPQNQRLLFFFYSDSVVFPAPQVNGFARLRFRDA